ncbi:MAG: dockerin type I repeat-containing protein [Ruminococcus sp.]|nr:dockerin type I repeat-containing protein [Ruminococcus sp.]
MIGDADLNGTVEILDVTCIQRAINYIVTLSKEQTAAADSDQNGEVTIVDATCIQRYLSKLKLNDSQIGEYVTICIDA